MRLILSILFIFLQLNSFSQVPTAYSFSELHDFLPKTIYHMHEDVNKNMWFATDDGLYKWNGNELEIYQNLNYSNNYSSIQEDSTGRVWCLNFTGQLFYVNGNDLELFVDEKKWISSTFNYNISFFPKIYITSNYGLIEYDFESKEKKISYEKELQNSKKFIIDENQDTIYNDVVDQVVSYKKGVLFFRGGDIMFKEANKPLERMTSYAVKNLISGSIIFKFDSKVLLISNKKLKNKSPFIIELGSDKSINEISLDFDNEITSSSFFYDNEKQLFLVGAKNGMLLLNKEYQSIFKDKILEGKNVSGFVKDFEGNYWVSTLNDGIYIIPSFDILQYNFSSIQGKQFSHIVKGKDNAIYLIAPYGEIYLLEGNEIRYLGSFNQQVESIVYNPYRNEIYAGNLRTTFNLDLEQTKKSVYGRNFKSISFLDANTTLVSSSGNASLRTVDENNSLFLKLFGASKFQYNSNEDFIQSEIRGKRSGKNAYDAKNKIGYISYSDGLYYYQNGIEKEIRYNNSPILPTNIAKVLNGSVWLTTIKGDLLKIKKGKVIEHKELNVKAKEILFWKNHLFMNTNDGLLRWNIKTQEQNWVNTEDGLLSNDILDIEIVNDTLYLVSGKGLVKLACSYEYFNRHKPLVTINKLAIWEKDTALFDLYSLDYNQNNITIYFGANATRSQKKYTYEYRILGIDSSWVSQSGGINFARFPTIPSGRFTFQVKVINEDGIESEIAEVKLIIDAPFYQKWWFYLLMGFIVVLIVGGVFMVRIKVLQKQNAIINDKKEVEKQLSQSQLTALRSQMNPHFIFNALNSIQDYIISNNKDLASDYLGLFADLMRKYLHFSNEDEIILEEEIETLEMYLKLEKVRFEETLFYHVNVDSNLDVLDIKIPVMLLQPFVENAIKHGLLHKEGERILSVNFNKKENNLIISIKDNGVGREKSAELNKNRNKSHQSYATSAQQKRITLLNEQSDKKISITYTDLYSENNEAEGTLVEVVIPL